MKNSFKSGKVHKKQNVVILHDFLIERGGGERIVLALPTFLKGTYRNMLLRPNENL